MEKIFTRIVVIKCTPEFSAIGRFIIWSILVFGCFSRLVIQEITNHSGLFEGPEDHKFFCHNLKLLEENKYQLAGRLIGMSLMHDGPGLGCLHPTLFYLMCGLPCNLNHFDVKQILDTKFVEVIDQVSVIFHLL